MELASMPKQFSSVFGELIYLYEQGSPDEPVFEAEILGGDTLDVLGIKRFDGAARIGVNAAGYLRGKLSPMPVVGPGSGFFEDTGRSVKCAVRHDGATTPTRIFTSALEGLSVGQLLTCLPLHRDIARSENDEISFVSEGGVHYAVFEAKSEQNFTFSTQRFEVREGICTLLVDMPWAMSCLERGRVDVSKCRSIHVRIFGPSGEFANVIYIFRDNRTDAVRLCWLNSLGAIDSFTFQNVASRQVKAAKERILSEEGYVTVASSAERGMEVNSGYQPQAVLDALSEIALSTRVWVCRGGEFVPVDVISDSAEIKTGELGYLKLKLRESNITNYQTF